MKQNYQLLLDGELEKIAASGRIPSLLLHSCCAPCSSYVLEYLSRYFAITVYYYNPNIAPQEEYDKRAEELRRLLEQMPLVHPVRFFKGAYEPDAFYALARGHETEPEGGPRCLACYRLRLGETARNAHAGGFDYFTTTLSISPHKNAEQLNMIGRELSERCGTAYLYSDFKKKNGYRRSCELSAQYGLYRQNYCGCVYSKQNARQNEGNPAAEGILAR